MLLSPGDSVYVLRDQLAAETVMVQGRPVAVPHALALAIRIARRAIGPGDKGAEIRAPISSAQPRRRSRRAIMSTPTT